MKNKLILSFLEPLLIARTLDDQQGLKELFPQHKLNILKFCTDFAKHSTDHCGLTLYELIPQHHLRPSIDGNYACPMASQWAEMTRLKCPLRRPTPELTTSPELRHNQEN